MEELRVTIISANLRGRDRRMSDYMMGSLSNDPSSQQRTYVDSDLPMQFIIPTSSNPNNLFLNIHLKCQRTLRSDRVIAEARVPVQDLLRNASDTVKFVSYPVRKPSSGELRGVIYLSYTFGEPGMAHPTPAPAVNGAPPTLPQRRPSWFQRLGERLCLMVTADLIENELENVF